MLSETCMTKYDLDLHWIMPCHTANTHAEIRCLVIGEMALSSKNSLRQRVLVLYLRNSSLDSAVIGWSQYDGTGQTLHMAGDSSEPPYPTGLDALLDGWRLFQASQLQPHGVGDEFRTGYLKYEFFFEQIVAVEG